MNTAHAYTQNAYSAPQYRCVSSSRAHTFKRKRRRMFFKAALRLLIMLLLFALCFSGVKYAFDNYVLARMAAKNAPPLQMQNPELPNGCEATSLAMALTSAGVKTDKLTAYSVLPKQDFEISNSGVRLGANPDETYAGDATSQSGFYCFAPPVAQAANELLQKAQSGLSARDITGASAADLKQYSANGAKLVVFVTKQYKALEYCENFVWYIEETGEQYRPYANLHCVFVYGFKDGCYLVNDPLYGSVAVKASQFEESYIQLGQRAVIIE